MGDPAARVDCGRCDWIMFAPVTASHGRYATDPPGG